MLHTALLRGVARRLHPATAKQVFVKVLATSLTMVAFGSSAKADPGTPGVPQAPITVYTENLQNRPGPTPIVRLNAYTGATGQTYTAHANWLTACNGWIAAANQPPTAAAQVNDCGSQINWNRAQQLSWSLGLHAGQSQAAAQSNFAVSAYTAGNPGAGNIEFATAQNIPFITSNRYLSFKVDVAAINCQVSAPLFQFSLVNDSGVATPAGSQINVCANGTSRNIPALGVVDATTASTGTYTSNGAVLITGSSFGIRLVNNNGVGQGNDHAFDNIGVLDATPQLDKSFSPTVIDPGETSTLTFTITNTSELGAKNGWSFTDALPANLVVASVAPTTTCPSGTVTAPANGSTITVSGNLTAGMSSCTATVSVTSTASGTYTNDASNITSAVGVNPPGSATLTVRGVADLSITKDDGVTTYTPGLDASYTIVVTNNGPEDVTGARISDPLPSGITTAAWACGGETGGATCGAPSGTGAIDTTADLPSGSSVTYSLSMGVPSSYSGMLTNTATVTAPDGVTDTDTSNNTASDTDTIAPPPTSGACSPVRVVGNTTFNAAPLPLTGSVQKSGAPRGWDTANPWSTLGGNYTFRWTFSQPIPANWINFAVVDVGANSYQTTPARITIAVAGGTATISDFSFMPGWRSDAWDDLLWNGSTGVMSYNPSGEIKQAGSLQGNSTDTVTSITITTSNVDSVDFISNLLYVRPACLTVSKMSQGGTGSFPFNMTNVVQANGTAVSSTTLTTTSAGTAVSTPAYNSVPGADVALSEVVPEGWNLASAVCTDQNAGGTGNPTVIGSFTSPTLTIPAANVRPQSDIQCTFTNSSATDLAISKDDGVVAYMPGGNVTYNIVVTNNGPSAVTGATVKDPLPAGITTATWTCGGATSGAACGAASGSGAIDTTADLPAGASVTYRLTMNVPADFTGNLTNTATVAVPQGLTDTDPSNNSASDTDVPGAPALTIEKTGTLNDNDGDGLIDLGETINYSFKVTNTGNVTLTNVTVKDPLLDNAGISVSPGPQTLAPGGMATFTATYTPDQADIDAGQVSNTATGTGTPPGGGDPIDSPPDTVVVPPDQTPALTIEKTGTLNDSDGDNLIDLGETISYSFKVTNTGTVTLSGVTVKDPLLANAGISVSPGPQTLQPGGTVTFTATYTPDQADIDAGQVSNTAVGTGTPPPAVGDPIDSPPDTVVVPPDQNTGLTIEKTGTLDDLDSDGLIDPGESISYTFKVTNTGSVTLTNVTVNDPKVTINEGPQTLAPGESFTFTAAPYTPTQAEIDAGRVENTATGSGTPPGGGDPIDSPPDTVVVPPDQGSGLTIEKTGALNDTDGDGLIDLGETIIYTFKVKNTGNVTLTNVTVNDPLLTNSGISVSPGPQTLKPGGTATFTAEYTPDQADIDAGQVSNTATGTGTPPSGPPIESPPDTVVVPPDQTPALTIEKTGTLNDSDGDGLIDLGETISYSFKVTNTGTVTLSGVTVNDPLLASKNISVSPGPQTLQPGGMVTFTATYTPDQADIDAGQVSNTATGTGTPPGGGDPIDSPPDTVVVPPDVASAMTIEKTGTLNDLDGDGLIDMGETISYAFKVTNTGNVTLTNVTVNDPLLTSKNIAVSPGPQTLQPGGMVTFTATYTPDQADIDAGRVENTATGTGTPPSGPPIESPPDTVVVPPDQASGLTIDKQGTLNDRDGDGLLDPGETISYSFLVTNTGNVTLTGVTVRDPKVTVNEAPQTLAPGQSFTFTATYQPDQAEIDAGQVSNTATGTGTPPGGGDPIDSPPDTVVVPPDQASGLTVDKQGTLNDRDGDGFIDAGETITYTFLVRNIGNVTMTNVTVNDPLLANAGITVTPGPQTLAPGGSVTFTATYQPKQEEIDAGRVENTATPTGTPPSGPPVEGPPDTVVVPPDPNSGMTIDKQGTLNDLNGNNLIDLGETIDYAFVVTNTGAVTLTNVTVKDPKVTINEGPQTLAPGASFTFTASYTPTQADIDAGSVSNTATGTGTPPSGPPVESPPDTVVVPPVTPSTLKIEKQGTFNDKDGNGYASLGDTITYSFTVTNTGGQVITDVMPVDDGPTFNGKPATAALSAFTPESVTLEAHGSQVFTATYTLTQEDIDNAAGVPEGMENSATAKGNTGGNPVPSTTSTSKVTIPPAEPSDISIIKQAGLRQIKRGEKAPFTIKVTNHSSRNVGSVSVTDIIPSGFRYIDGSATIDGTAVTPVIAGQRVRFDNVALGPNAEVVIRLQMLALSSAGPGKHTNKATVNGLDGSPLAPEARADIEIMIEPVFDCGDIIGKVFDDLNRNGYQDKGEPGLPGVRIATVRGSLVTTDKHGRFHVACADLPDQRIGSNFIMKVDPRTLPAGYRLTTENPRVIRLTAGKMSTLNFGASIGRVVRLELADAAFEPGTTTLKQQWQKGIDQLIAALETEPSTLRIGYGAAADAKLARERIEALEEDITKRWRSVTGRYELNIETRVEAGQ